jgi:mono/diheme cytochrome c family protein
MKLKITAGIVLASAALLFSCQNDDQLEFSRYYSSGSMIYQNKCQNCHGTNGEGLAGLMPPLTDSVYLKTNKAALACGIKYGLNGKITVANRTFIGQMPASDLSPIEISEVLTYITNSFGNKLGVTTSQQVDNVLKECK